MPDQISISLMASTIVGVGALGQVVPARPTLRGHIQIARIDHWFKNVFVLPGIIAAIGLLGNIPAMQTLFAPTAPTILDRR